MLMQHYAKDQLALQEVDEKTPGIVNSDMSQLPYMVSKS